MKYLVIIAIAVVCAACGSKKPPKTFQEHKDSVQNEVRGEIEKQDSAILQEIDSIKSQHDSMREALEARKDSLTDEIWKVE